MQLSFGFIQEMDDKRDSIARIDGSPVLNYGNPTHGLYQSGWIHRRWYDAVKEALDDAIRASKLVNVPLYVVDVASDTIAAPDYTQNRWRISTKKPFCGKVGDFIIPFRPYYVLRSGVAIPLDITT